MLFILVGAAGFEPTLTESESGVLPLNYAPMRRVLYNAFFRFAIKICAFGGKIGIFMILCPYEYSVGQYNKFSLGADAMSHRLLELFRRFAGRGVPGPRLR